MNHVVYRIRFEKSVPMNHIEDSLLIASIAAEALHGRAAVKLDGYCCLDKKTRSCVIDAETQTGCDIARIVSTLIMKGHGESSIHTEVAEEHNGNRRLLCAIGDLL